MNLIIKQILIVFSVFLIILWFQHLDDKRNKKQRTTYYQKFKLPLFVAAITGLILSLYEYISNTNKIFVTPTITETQNGIKSLSDSVKNGNNNLNTKINNFSNTIINPNAKNNISGQDIFTDLPDF